MGGGTKIARCYFLGLAFIRQKLLAWGDVGRVALGGIPQSDPAHEAPIARRGSHRPSFSQRGLTAATKLEDWIDYAIRSDCAPFSLAQFDNLAQKTRLSRLVVQRRSIWRAAQLVLSFA